MNHVRTVLTLAALSSLFTVGMAHARDRHDGRSHAEHHDHDRARPPVRRAEPRHAEARIINDSGVRMQVVLDGRALGVTAPGQSIVSWPLAPGRYTVEARPVDRRYQGAPALTRSLSIHAGERPTVALGAWHARVDVYNPFPFAATLRIDGDRVATLSPYETRVVARQVPGRIKLELDHGNRTMARETMHVAPGREVAWRPVDARRGEVRVSNYSGRRVQVTIDGRDYGRLRDGDVKVFGGFAPGVHLVTLTQGKRVVEQQRVRVEADGVATMVAADARRGRGRGPAPAPLARR